MKHQAGKREVVEAGECLCEAFVVARQTSKRAAHAKLRSTTQRRGSRNKPRFASVCLTTSQPNVRVFGAFFAVLPV